VLAPIQSVQDQEATESVGDHEDGRQQ
jgi:hypothetical protein